MSGILIRLFAETDLSGIFAARRSAIRDVAARDYTPVQIDTWAGDSDDYPAQLKRFTESETWVAGIGGQIAGFTNLASDGYLDCMYVHASYQGRGVAAALLAALEAGARAADITRLYADVSITARPFFERRGFTVVNVAPRFYGGVEYLNSLMEKHLT